MLDMGFERDMEDCLNGIKAKAPHKFSNIEG